MASLTTLKLTNRSAKQPIRKLPESLDIEPETTVEDVKKIVAKKIGYSDFNRIGVYDPSTKRTIKNRKARIDDEPAVVAAGEVLIKDLGLQLDWRTVFIIEYIGPLLFHFLVLGLRPYIYSNGDQPMSQTQWLTFGMIVAHFIKREYETMFVHKFSANTMPARNIFKNSFFYWVFSGLLCAYVIYSPSSLAARANEPLIDATGFVLYLFGEISNAIVHQYLSSLRTKGGTERKIPVGYGFSLVTCPNYMFEVIAWVGMIVVSRDWSVALFIGMGIVQMFSWAKGKERTYRKEFGDLYKKKRYVMLPGLL